MVIVCVLLCTAEWTENIYDNQVTTMKYVLRKSCGFCTIQTVIILDRK